MIIVLLVVQTLVFIVIGFFIAYLGMLTVLSLTRKERRSFPSRSLRRFAVVVPAHNEALVIGETLKSLTSLEYPGDRYDIVVVADNCDDDTAELAAKAGAHVMVRRDQERRGKGYALRWCFDRLLADTKNYDAVVVIDADSVVSHNFLIVMNHDLERGARVIQSSDLADSGSRGWSSEMIRLSFLLYNFVRPLGRSAIGCSAGLKGNGMCFARSVLLNVPWSSFSLNEDLEYGLELLLRGISVHFAPEAKALAKMPQGAQNAQSQRVRWEAGRFPVIQKYGFKLITAALKRRSFELFDAFVELVTPSLVNMFLVSSGMFAFNVAMALLDVDGALTFTLLWMSVLALGFLHVTVGIAAAGSEMSSVFSLLHVPRYIAWKLKLYVRAGRSRNGKGQWVRTTREVLPHDPKRKSSSDAKE